MPGIGKTRSRGLRKVSGGRLGQRGVEAPETAGASAALEGVPRYLTQPERTIIVLRYGIGVRQPKSSRTSPRRLA
jgi:hypothetical protein